MVELRAKFRIVTGFFLAVMGSLILFGVSLALFWRMSSSSPSLKLIGLGLSSGLALLLGGYIFAWWSRIDGLLLPAISGFFLGGFSAAYILGPTLPALGLGSCAAFLASLGAYLQRRWAGDRRSSGEGM